jgi:hypothetical protein
MLGYVIVGTICFFLGGFFEGQIAAPWRAYRFQRQLQERELKEKLRIGNYS